MRSDNPNLAEMISGILTFSAIPGERIPLQKVHSIIWEMKSQTPLFSGIDYLLEGDTFYSRQIERVIQDLISKGILKTEDYSTAVVENACSVAIRLSIDLSYTDCKSLRSASSIFYKRLRGTGKSAQERFLPNVA